MLKPGFEAQEMDLRIQWSLITRIKAAARVYRSATAAGSAESLKDYLSALEGLVEYIATRCRGSVIFEEVKATGYQELAVQTPAKGKKRGSKLLQLKSTQAPAFAVAASEVSCETLAG
jgi:hypothetical protein